MEGHPHVQPCPLVPPPVHPLKSSLPSLPPTSLLNPRSGFFLPSSSHPNSEFTSSSRSAPSPTPHPHPPPYPFSDPLSSTAATAAPNYSFPISTSSIFAPSSSSVYPLLPGAPAPTSSPPAAPPLSSLNLNSATVSSAVSTSLSTTQIPSSASPAVASSINLSSSSALPSLPSPLLPTPSLQAPSAPHIPQVPPKPSSNPLSLSVPAFSKPSSAPKHQQPSYAQVARGPRGPSFVRSHASDIESFARLPRTGINIISGSREGLPSFSFVNSDLPKVEGLYSQALVMKFHGGRPSLEASHKEILSWGIE